MSANDRSPDEAHSGEFLLCPFTFMAGHMVDPEDMSVRRCSRLRFHLGTHDMQGLCIGRWWIWQHPGVRLRNYRRHAQTRVMRWRHSRLSGRSES